jgi:hypothetical protein
MGMGPQVLLIDFLSITGEVNTVLIKPNELLEQNATDYFYEIVPDTSDDFLEVVDRHVYNFSRCRLSHFLTRRKSVQLRGYALSFEWTYKNIHIGSNARYLLVMPQKWQIQFCNIVDLNSNKKLRPTSKWFEEDKIQLLEWFLFGGQNLTSFKISATATYVEEDLERHAGSIEVVEHLLGIIDRRIISEPDGSEIRQILTELVSNMHGSLPTFQNLLHFDESRNKRAQDTANHSGYY